MWLRVERLEGGASSPGLSAAVPSNRVSLCVQDFRFGTQVSSLCFQVLDSGFRLQVSGFVVEG